MRPRRTRATLAACPHRASVASCATPDHRGAWGTIVRTHDRCVCTALAMAVPWRWPQRTSGCGRPGLARRWPAGWRREYPMSKSRDATHRRPGPDPCSSHDLGRLGIVMSSVRVCTHRGCRAATSPARIAIRGAGCRPAECDELCRYCRIGEQGAEGLMQLFWRRLRT